MKGAHTVAARACLAKNMHHAAEGPRPAANPETLGPRLGRGGCAAKRADVTSVARCDCCPDRTRLFCQHGIAML